MHKVYYQPEGIWVGDIMPYGEDGTFYLYHQRDTRNPGPFGEPFGWALATTKDFVNYKDFGESLERGGDEEVDQYVYAGTVFKVGDKYHALYTGCNRDKVKARLMKQVLLHATSDDAVKWEKNIAETLLPPQEGYDDRNWRDPFVLWDEENEEYMLILGTRVGEVFSEYSDGNKTRYRMSRSINGPWITPADDSFDGRAYYAARTAFDGERRVLFGWVPTRDEGGDPSSYLWGGTFMPLEIVQRADGTLGTKLPDSMLGAFGEAKAVEAFELSCESGKVEQVLAADAGSTYMLDADIELAGDAAGFSVKLAEDAESGLAYEFRANLREGKLEFTAAPQYPWFQVNNMGLERPLFFKGEGTHHVRLVVDDDIATIFVDDVALNARFCNKQGQGVALTVTDGTLKCANATIASL